MTNHEIKGQKETVFNIFFKRIFGLPVEFSLQVLVPVPDLFQSFFYVPSSFSLFSNMFCFLRILDFSECIIFHICTRADMKYYAPASVEL